MRFAALFVPLLFACAVAQDDPALVEVDLLVYGNTSAGVATAVQAKRLGLSVALVGPERHLGGLTSGGLGWTDSGRKEVVGGLSREFYQRVKAEYDRPETWRWQKAEEYARYRAEADAQWTFEPSIAEKVFVDMLREAGVPVWRDEWLDRSEGVRVADGKIREIRMLSGRRFRAKIFVDAGYEGDLMAAAGVSFSVGREANAQYGETLNGVQPGRRWHQFTEDISPYQVEGDPSSGLLPRVSAEAVAETGSADHKIQAYTFRTCLTRVEENRVPFPRPEGYDADQYELLLRAVLAGSDHYRGKFDMLPNGKTDTNNSGSYSTDNIGFNYAYPEASYAERAAIVEEHRVYQQGFYWFLANDPRVPEEDQTWVRAWGLAGDEFLDNANWPHQIYVREARRMVGDFVVTENHLTRRLDTPHPIGMGSYNMDSHHVQRYVDADGFVRNEGDVQVSPGGPYPIDLGAILPRRTECSNLLVTCAVSSSHIAYGSIRMEPVFMVLGHSAADAAALAIGSNCAVQDLDYERLAQQLEAEGQVLAFESVSAQPPAALDLSQSPGVVVDDDDAKLTGSWTQSSALASFIGRGYRHDGNSKAPATARFDATLPHPGLYELRLYYPPHANRSGQTLVRFEATDGPRSMRISQRRSDPGRAYFLLGRYHFGSETTLHISNAAADGFVVIDAVEWIPLELGNDSPRTTIRSLSPSEQPK
jgi:FAD dependent oxidoreductase